jgi:hypothetical protein
MMHCRRYRHELAAPLKVPRAIHEHGDYNYDIE